MTMPAAIEVCAVDKSFPADYSLTSWMRKLLQRPPRREILTDISFAVSPGEVFGILGPNGAGKTTLLKMLATLLLPDRGTIRIAGVDAVRDPLAAKRRMGLSMSDERSFYYRLSARRNLEFFAVLCDVAPEHVKRRVDEVIDVVDLGFAADRLLMSFSSGMRQRLAVARALLGDPQILIFDEPTRTVDPIHALELRALMRDRLARELEKTVLLSTNVLEEAWSLCDRIGILSGGRLVALGAPEALAARYAERRRYAITFDRLDPGLPVRLLTLPGVEEVEVKPSGRGDVIVVSVDLHGRNFTGLLAAISENGSVVRNMRELDDALFDVFRAATSERGQR